MQRADQPPSEPLPGSLAPAACVFRHTARREAALGAALCRLIPLRRPKRWTLAPAFTEAQPETCRRPSRAISPHQYCGSPALIHTSRARRWSRSLGCAWRGSEHSVKSNIAKVASLSVGSVTCRFLRSSVAHCFRCEQSSLRMGVWRPLGVAAVVGFGSVSARCAWLLVHARAWMLRR